MPAEGDERASLLPTVGGGDGGGGSPPARYDGSSGGSSSSRRRPPSLDSGRRAAPRTAVEGEEEGEPLSLRKEESQGSFRSRSSDFLRTLSSSISLSYGPFVNRGGSNASTSGSAGSGAGAGNGERKKGLVGQKWQSLDVYQSLAGVTRHPSLAHEVGR